MNRVTRTTLPCLGFVLLILTGCASPRGEWYQRGGPHQDFVVPAAELADSWPEDGPPALWKRELGDGYSGIAVAGGRLYTMFRRDDQDVVVALDPKDGSTVWEYAYDSPTSEGQVLDFGKGPNSTPLVVNGRVITVGFGGLVNCVSARDGRHIWSINLVEDFGGKVHQFGYAPSPVLSDGQVILAVGGEQMGILAVDPGTGEPIWHSPPSDISYATPLPIDVDGIKQIVFMTSTEVVGVNAGTGEESWRHPCVNQYKNNASDPIWGPEDNLLWVATQLDGGTRTLHLTREGDDVKVERAWFNDKVKIFHWNAVRVGNHVYGSIGGRTTMLAAVDAKTGEIKWRKRGFHKALSLYADDKLIFLDENGVLGMAKVSPDNVKILSQAQVTDKVSWTVPTLVGKTLYVRDKAHIMALDLS